AVEKYFELVAVRADKGVSGGEFGLDTKLKPFTDESDIMCQVAVFFERRRVTNGNDLTFEKPFFERFVQSFNDPCTRPVDACGKHRKLFVPRFEICRDPIKRHLPFTRGLEQGVLLLYDAVVIG